MSYIIEHKEALSLIVLLCISELLPFSDKVKANGIFEAILNGLKKVSQPKAEEISKQ